MLITLREKFMRKLMLLLTFLVVGIGLVDAQVRRVTGVVTSAEDGLPVIGASVLVKGTSIGTITDYDGKFEFDKLPSSAKILQISYVGMKTQEVSIKPHVKVVLQSDSEALDEVVVVAYGTAKKSSFAGSATQVRGEKIQKMQVSDVSKALDGAIAGVQIASSSGTPGSSAAIRIRGIGSINASQEPLIVVDGVPYEGSLNSISTQDIESLTVLKDAAANSMYGARGANGVIMITTKGGKAGKLKVNFEVRAGFNARGVDTYETIDNPGAYYEMQYEAYRNSLIGSEANPNQYAADHLIDEKLNYNIYKGIANNQIIDPATGKLTAAAAAAALKWNDNWRKDPFENGMRQEYNLNVGGGNEKTTAYISFSYLTDEGYVKDTGFDRLALRAKVTHKITDNIKVGANIAYANTVQKIFGDEGTNYSNIFGFTQSIAPIYPIYLYDANGEIQYNKDGTRAYDYGDTTGRPYGANNNPVGTIADGINEKKQDNLSSRAFVEFKFLKDFKFTANMAYDVFNTYETEYMTPNAGDAKNVGGRGYKTMTRYGALNVNQLLNWSHSFGKHNLSVLLGHEIKKDREEYLYGHMTNFVDPNNPEFKNASRYEDLTSANNEYALEGYFSQFNYNYADRYYLTASLRRDGSSRFAPDVRWGTFWAVGASWRVNEESFMENVKWVNSLKVKASYGTQGNDNIGYYKAYDDLYEVGRVNGSPALSKIYRGNPGLTWEKKRDFNVGFEAKLFDRFSISFDYFIKKTVDMLYKSPIPASEGDPNWIYKNEMDMKNTGYELALSADVIKSSKVNWTMDFNITHYKNELTRLPSSKPADKYPNGYKAGSFWRKIGGSLYDYYTYEYAGVDTATGEALYNKYDDDGNVTTVKKTSNATLRETGKSAIPDFTGGISTTFSAYGFDLSIATAFQLGGYVMDGVYQGLMSPGDRGEAMHVDLLNRWMKADDITNVPMVKYDYRDGNASSDRWLTSASYFNLRNVTLGYTIPQSFLKKLNIENMRVYLSGDNILLLSKRTGLDPRQSFSGSVGNNYSAISTYSVGLNLTF
jgi:TonB-linked SusC/RagA family outer membrane protein